MGPSVTSSENDCASAVGVLVGEASTVGVFAAVVGMTTIFGFCGTALPEQKIAMAIMPNTIIMATSMAGWRFLGVFGWASGFASDFVSGFTVVVAPRACMDSERVAWTGSGSS